MSETVVVNKAVLREIIATIRDTQKRLEALRDSI